MYFSGQVLSQVFSPVFLSTAGHGPAPAPLLTSLGPQARMAHRVHNFEVEEHHTYVAGGLRAHNTSVVSFLSFAQLADVQPGSLKDLDGDGRFDYVELDNGLGGLNAAGSTVYKMTTLNGETVVKVFLTHTDALGRLVQTQFYQTEGGAIIEGTIVNFELTGAEFGYRLGGLVTPFITAAILGDDASIFERFAVDTIVGTFVQNLFEFAGGAIHDQIVSHGLQNGTLDDIASITFHDFTDELITNAVDNASVLLSQWIMAEVFEGLNTDEFAGKFAFLLAQEGVNYILDLSVHEIATDVLSLDVEQINSWGLSSDEFSSIFSAENLMSLVFRAAIGTILPDLESTEAQIGSSVITLALDIFAGVGGVVGAALGYIGGLILDIFFDEDPSAFTQVIYSDLMEKMVLEATSTDDGGSAALSRAMAQSFADFMNGLIESARANSHNLGELSTTTNFRFGHNEDDLVNGNGKSYGDAQSAITQRMLDAIVGLQLLDGDLKVAKAISSIVEEYGAIGHNADERIEILNELSMRIQIATDYQAYLENQEMYDQLITVSGTSAFSAGWAQTFLLAEKYGYTSAINHTSTLEDDALYASSGDDTLLSGAGNDTLHGYSGDDLLDGEDGDDSLWGGAGSDTLYGGDGKDTIIGGAGADSILGNDGNDVFYAAMGGRFQNADGSYQLAVLGDDTIDGGADQDLIYFDGLSTEYSFIDSGNNVVEITHNISGDKIFLSAVEFLVFEDRVMTFDPSYSSVVTGSFGSDLLEGTDLDDALLGLAGNDVIYGFDGNDLLSGDEGDDTLFGGAGNDWIFGVRGNDVLHGGTGDDTMSGGTEADYIWGDDGRDSITGDASDDVIAGGELGDTVDGGDGDDLIDGGDGDDLLIGGNGDDAIWGGSGEDTLRGDRNDDELHGGLGNDTLYGDGGDDELHGDDGDDRLEGDVGDDVFYGGSGHDTIIGSWGDDTVFGGEGDDTIFALFGSWASSPFNFNYAATRGNTGADLWGEWGADVAYGEGGNDQIALNGGGSIAFGGSGDDAIFIMQMQARVNGGSGTDTVWHQTDDFTDVVWIKSTSGRVGAIVFDTDANMAKKSYSSYRTLPASELSYTLLVDVEFFRSEEGGLLPQGYSYNYGYGTGKGGRSGIYTGFLGWTDEQFEAVFSDEAFLERRYISVFEEIGGQESGEYGAQMMTSWNVFGADDDLINDTNPALHFTGDQRIDAGAGNDSVYGGGGNDQLNGNTGDDTIDGWSGNDLIWGGEGHDSIESSTGDDTVWGGTDDDTIKGWAGDDSLMGEDGNDSILGQFGDDTLSGGNGDDIIWGGSGRDSILGGANDDMLYGEDAPDTINGGDGSDQIRGGDGGDSLSGDDGNDMVSGGYGADLIYGDFGDDTLFGDTGHDLLHGGAGNDSISGDADNDDLWGDDGNDSLAGGEGLDELHGGSGSDSLNGGIENDMLWGDAGNDTLEGEDGNDQLLGGSGDDYLVGGAGADSIDGGDGFDALSYWSATAAIRIDLEAGWGYAGEALNDQLSNIEKVLGSGHNDTIVGDWHDNHFNGYDGDDLLDAGTGNDTIYASDGNDTVLGADGDDRLFGEIGNDLVEGGQGDDLLSGGSGHDHLMGENGQDTLRGDDGNDALDGGGDDDTLSGGVGSDTLWGNTGNDSLNGDDGDDLVSGGAGDDRVSGGNGADIVNGDGGNDRLWGGAGSDQLFGGAGSDTIWGQDDNDIVQGGAGDDLIWAGAGNDILFGDSGSDTLNGEGGSDVFMLDYGTGHDVVADFVSGIDRIGLRASATQIAVFDDVAGARVQLEPQASLLLNGIAASEISLADFAYDSGLDVQIVAGISGTDSDDSLTGTDDSDVILGGLGNDFIVAAAGADSIYGGAGSDSLYGNDGDDLIDGGDGDDLHEGGAGNDTILGSLGLDSFDGGEGLDLIDFSYTSNDLAIDLLAETVTVFEEPVEVMVGFEAAAGGSGNDELRGTGGDDTLLGGEGNDSLYGLGGNDQLDGGLGDDVIFAQAGDDTITYSGGNDVIDGRTVWNYGNDTLYLGQYSLDQLGFRIEDTYDLVIETPDGSITLDYQLSYEPGHARGNIEALVLADASYDAEGMKTLAITSQQSDGDDAITGSHLSDTIAGGLGNDTIAAGSGDDLIVYLGGADEILRDNYGSDTLFIGNYTFDEVSFSVDGYYDTLITTPDGTIRLDYQLRYETGDSRGNIETIVFADGGSIDTDLIRAASISGQQSAGDDAITGTYMDDVIAGGLGNDTIAARSGDDIIYYEGGDDLILGYQERNIGTDTLVLSQYSSDQVSFSRSGYNTLITTPDGSILLEYQMRYEVGHERGNIEAIVFSDGVLDAQGIADRSNGLAPTTELTPAAEAGVPLSPPDPIVVEPDPVLASMLLASDPSGDSFNLAPSEEQQVAAATSSAQLSSQIDGDALDSGGGSSETVDTGESGALVDDMASDDAFLSATQLAALDGDQASIY